ncbi:MAG: GMC family oxidoreductase, partial [Myxococcaceae bacterium]|nr:GMC family oxidoreductase [Myxococcaceae bacterium]
MFRRTAIALLLPLFAACAGGEAGPCVRCTAEGPPEYIVVGSGAGGGPLAARLARAGRRVLLLEAGDDVGGRLQYQVPAMHALSTEDAEHAWWFWVKHHTDEAVDAADSKHTADGILYPRGSALGGSTAVNAMVTVLPPPADWNRLAELTFDRGFRASAMTPYFDRVREWLSIELPDPRLALGDPQVTGFLTAAATTFEGAGLGGTGATTANVASLLQGDVNQTLKSGEASGLYRLPLATRDGKRNGTREQLLATVAEGYPLTLVTGAFVTRVLWAQGAETPTAIGVEYVKKGKVYEASLKPEAAPPERLHALASREVILSAGVFNTPQLLMLSGIGERAQLEQHGIAPVAEVPGVGKNLQDRYEAPVVYDLGEPVDVLRGCRLGEADDPCLTAWHDGRGVYRTPGFLASLLFKATAGSPLADVQAFAVPSDARGYYPGYSRDSAAAKQRFTWLLLKAHTKNRDGDVRLAGASPFTRPSIHFHSFDEQSPLGDPDLAALVDGVKLVRQVQRSLRDVVA